MNAIRAQVSTILFFIVMPDCYGAVVLDGTMGPAGDVTATGKTYEITANMGNTTGNNLFHSFDRFSVETGYTANFSGPGNINNIIGRITGSGISNIDGNLSSSIQGANLFLLNPNGIMFGPNASLNISGSFYASTANTLKLGQTGEFNAGTPANTILSISNPSAFGFSNPNPAAIGINESRLSVSEGETISLIGGDIDINSNTTNYPQALIAPSGTVEVVSVASAGEVRYSNNDIDIATFTAMGNISITDGATIDAGGNGGGTVVIKGGQLTVDSSQIYANSTGPSSTLGEGIDVQLTDDLRLDNGSVFGSNVIGDASNSGGINISAANAQITNGSKLESVVFLNSTNGDSGDISISANTVSFSNGGYARTNTGGIGDAGSINIQANQLDVLDGGGLYSLAFAGSGSTGDININASDITVSGVNNPFSFTAITAQTSTAANAANINITTNNLTVNRGAISTPTFSAGQGGNIGIDSENIYVSGVQGQFWGIFATTFGAGNAGKMTINNSKDLIVTDRASIQTSTLGKGAIGNSGDMLINTGYLEISGASFVQTAGYFGAGGDGGDLTINASRILINGLESADAPFTSDSTAIFSGSGTLGGTGGDITINTGQLQMNNRASIAATSYGPGTSGKITVNAQDIEILSGSQISTGTFSDGQAKNININTDKLLVSGVHPDIFYDSVFGANVIAVSGIASSTRGSGDAGDININATNIDILDGAQIHSKTNGSGEGGDVHITSASLTVSGTDPALVQFAEDTTIVDPVSGIYSSSGDSDGNISEGNSGSIYIDTGALTISDNARLESSTGGLGIGGNIHINTTRGELLNGATLVTKSTGSGKAGNVSINTQESFSSIDSSIITQAVVSDGGDITINSNRYIVLRDSNVTASVLSQNGNGGNIGLTADLVVLNGSTITATAVDGNGGNIRIAADTIVTTADTQINATSEKSISGEITLSSIQDVTSSLIALPDDVADISGLLNDKCSIQASDDSSYFVANMVADKLGSRLFQPMAFINPIAALDARSPEQHSDRQPNHIYTNHPTNFVHLDIADCRSRNNQTNE